MATKSDIIAAAAEKLGQPKSAVTAAIDAVLDEITGTLRKRQDVKIAGLGTFRVKATAARRGRNPATGEAIDIPVGKKLTFKATADLMGKL